MMRMWKRSGLNSKQMSSLDGEKKERKLAKKKVQKFFTQKLTGYIADFCKIKQIYFYFEYCN